MGDDLAGLEAADLTADRAPGFGGLRGPEDRQIMLLRQTQALHAELRRFLGARRIGPQGQQALGPAAGGNQLQPEYLQLGPLLGRFGDQLRDIPVYFDLHRYLSKKGAGTARPLFKLIR